MIETIYIEEDVASHPRTREICERLPKATRVECERYGEILNRRAQNFRLQKRRPALILARKFDHFILDAPQGYGIGGRNNYYFSHMLNCVYDCRYCFLQGMFQSAYYVLFVNYEEFHDAIEEKMRQHPGEDATFFSGYDCDSLALEPLTGFARSFLPLFDRLDRAWMELRTKSTQVAALLERSPVERCVVAFSLTPEEIGRRLELHVPSLDRRLDAMVRLGERGWKLGLRFDPLIYHEGWRERYRRLFRDVFGKVRVENLHSVSLGAFRLPRETYKKMVRLYPDEKLLAGPLEDKSGMVSYRADLETELLAFCTEEILRYIPPDIFFPCTVEPFVTSGER